MKKAPSFYSKENREMWECKSAQEKRLLKERLKELQQEVKEIKEKLKYYGNAY